jgi:hypothetical protein
MVSSLSFCRLGERENGGGHGGLKSLFNQHGHGHGVNVNMIVYHVG